MCHFFSLKTEVLGTTDWKPDYLGSNLGFTLHYLGHFQQLTSLVSWLSVLICKMGIMVASTGLCKVPGRVLSHSKYSIKVGCYYYYCSFCYMCPIRGTQRIISSSQWGQIAAKMRSSFSILHLHFKLHDVLLWLHFQAFLNFVLMLR